MYSEEQMRQAYKEGFFDGIDHQNIGWKYLPPNMAWLESDTRRLVLKRLPTEKQDAAIQAYYDAPYAKKPDDLPGETEDTGVDTDSAKEE